ncbi:MAG: hypothetical protein KDJ36_17540 [Hyphomicrobiaceae bacterium]|nr:hypothetical protein [Hyphomicrobiaceae bacterium]
MSPPQRRIRELVAVTAAVMVTASLTACGGGSDAPVADAEPADKYVGIWTSGCQTTGSSYQYQFEMSKGGATAVNMKVTRVGYANPTCTGTPAGSQSTNYAFTIDGTGTASNKAVDKITLSAAFGGSFKQLFAVEGNLMYVSDGAPSQSYDTDGYPTKLNLNLPFTR